MLESLTRRLAECPVEILAEPRIGSTGQVRVEAVVGDLLHDLGGPPLTPAQASAFQPREARKSRNWLSLVLVAAWLLHEPWFQEQRRFAGLAGAFLAGGLTQLAGLAQAPKFVLDPDRREELARLCLKGLHLRPAGETIEQAADRLSTISTAERQAVMQAASLAEERARAVREAMAKKAADEAAAQYSRE
jgi:hypothetical protein